MRFYTGAIRKPTGQNTDTTRKPYGNYTETIQKTIWETIPKSYGIARKPCGNYTETILIRGTKRETRGNHTENQTEKLAETIDTVVRESQRQPYGKHTEYTAKYPEYAGNVR